MVLMFPIFKATSIGAGVVFPESGEIRTLALSESTKWLSQSVSQYTNISLINVCRAAQGKPHQEKALATAANPP